MSFRGLGGPGKASSSVTGSLQSASDLQGPRDASEGSLGSEKVL